MNNILLKTDTYVLSLNFFLARACARIGSLSAITPAREKRPRIVIVWPISVNANKRENRDKSIAKNLLTLFLSRRGQGC